MEELKIALEKHSDLDIQRFGSINQTLDRIEKNHLAHMEPDIAGLKNDLASMKADSSWLKWIGMAIVGGLIANFFQ